MAGLEQGGAANIPMNPAFPLGHAPGGGGEETGGEPGARLWRSIAIRLARVPTVPLPLRRGLPWRRAAGALERGPHHEASPKTFSLQDLQRALQFHASRSLE